MLISTPRNRKWLLIAFLMLGLAAIVYSLLQPWAEFEEGRLPAICSGYNGKASLYYFANSRQFGEKEQYCRETLHTLKIHTSIRDFLFLTMYRTFALRKTIILAEYKTPLPALIEFDQHKFKGNIRLKGDLADHLRFPMSLRVELNKGKQVMGMNQFSLQKLSVRKNDIDPLFNGSMNQEGILSPSFRFVQVEVNGIKWGLMEMEDHFTKELQESQQHKESLIGKFDEALIWDYETKYKTRGFYGNIYTTDFDFFSTKEISQNPKMLSDSVYAKSLIQGWQSNRLAPHHVFDLKSYQRFIAVAELWNTWHAMAWPNERFYYNPYLGKFEPVSFDNSYLIEKSSGLLSISNPPLNEIIQDAQYSPLFAATFKNEISRIGSDARLSQLEQQRNELIRILSPHKVVSNANLGLIRENRDFLLQYDLASHLQDQATAAANDANIPINRSAASEPHGTEKLRSLIRAVAYDNGMVEVINKLPHTVNIQKISFISGGINETLASNTNIPVQPTNMHKRFHPYYTTIPAEKNWDRLIITAEATHNNQVEDFTIDKPLLFLDDHYFAEREKENIDFIEMQEYIHKQDNNTYRIAAGNWLVRHPLIFPEGANVVIEAGSHLRFQPGTYIKTFGRLDIKGTHDNPVSLSSLSDSQTWNGILVVRAGEKSIWQWANIANTDFYREKHIQLTGAVTFYESDIELNHVIFTNSAAEDMLNTVHANFSLANVEFSGGASDAFDSDFCTGSISGSRFSNIGGDGLDTSGSTTTVTDSFFSHTHDKAISIGEDSRSVIERVTIKAAGTGLAAKDYSRATIRNSSIEQTEFADLMSYTKKEVYGGALLIADNIQTGDQPVLIVDRYSTMLFDNRRISNTNINIEKLYKSGPMKK